MLWLLILTFITSAAILALWVAGFVVLAWLVFELVDAMRQFKRMG